MKGLCLLAAFCVINLLKATEVADVGVDKEVADVGVDKEVADVGVDKEDKRAVLAGAAAAGAVLNGLSSFISGLNGPSNVKDTIISNRAMRIVVDGNCASITDRDTGFKSTKCAENAAQATALATEELVTLLIQLGQLSKDDLHLRPLPVTRPPTLCKDTVSLSKCQKHIAMGHCHIGSVYFHWMHENCYRSCAACNELDAIFPNKKTST